MKLERADGSGNILDPWNNAYVYVVYSDYTAAPGTDATYGPDTGGYFNPSSYQIFSMGMNGSTDTTVSGARGTDVDDLNNWYGDERKRH